VCGNACIPNAHCCTAADCPLTSQAASTRCTSGACGVNSCNGNFFDIDANYGNGCECGDAGFAKSCGTSTGLGTLDLGQSTSRTGNLPVSGGENWFSVTFAYTTAQSYHPRMSLSSAAGNSFVFDLYTNCSFNPLGCGDEGGSSIGRTAWDVLGGGAPTGQSFAPTPSVGTVFVRVRRAAGGVTCGSYTLSVGN
jgi:hypothetical protein